MQRDYRAFPWPRKVNFRKISKKYRYDGGRVWNITETQALKKLLSMLKFSKFKEIE